MGANPLLGALAIPPNQGDQGWILGEHLLICQMFRESAAGLKRRVQASAKVYTEYSTRVAWRIQPCTPFVEV